MGKAHGLAKAAEFLETRAAILQPETGRTATGLAVEKGAALVPSFEKDGRAGASVGRAAGHKDAALRAPAHFERDRVR